MPQTAAPGLVAPPTGAHVREHRSILAAAEKRLLVWIAHRLHPRITSDHLTALGALAMLATGAAFAAASVAPWALLLVPPALLLNWFGDSLDGTVARVRNRQRPRYGFYIDHVVDVVNATFLFTGLGLSGVASGWTAAGLLAGYLLLAAESFLAAHVLGVFRISFAGVGPTELRILLAAGALRAYLDPTAALPWLGERLLFDVGGAIGVAGMLAAFAANAARNAAALARADPLPLNR